MITQTMHQIVGRLVTDSDFRKRFFEQNAQTLNDYELTEQERAVLADMSTCTMTKAALSTVAFRYRQISNSVATAA